MAAKKKNNPEEEAPDEMKPAAEADGEGESATQEAETAVEVKAPDKMTTTVFCA